MARRISKPERLLVYTVIIIVDISQIILNFFVVGVIVNRILDVIVGILLFAYGFIRKLLTTRISLGIIGSFAIEEIPIVDVLPMWTLDVKWMYSTDDGKTEEEGYQDTEKLQEELTENARRGGIIIDDTRRANSLQKPLNQNGVRLPPGHQTPLPPRNLPKV